MKIDRLTTLALSLYSNRGAYALLLGSGISRSAHIPSAWEVENELIRKVAALSGVAEADDWHVWYNNEYGREAEYSTLLDELASTKTERVGLMRSFFEPSKQDREMGWKEPAPAHKAIAELAKKGFIKIILTTNFDRLIENALQSEGVVYQVILHESDLEKITPISHCAVPTVVKINGDYIDCRFRNTAIELESYPDELKRFLTRVFEDYGLITCGWSATWDKGLVDIMKNSALSRYNSFFTDVSKQNEDLSILAENRRGETIRIDGADKFFCDLNEQVQILDKNEISKTLGKDIVLAKVKKYLKDDVYEIEYTELIEGLVEEAYQMIQEIADYSQPLTVSLFHLFLERHRNAVSLLMDVAFVVGRWGKPEHVSQIGKGIVKLCILPFVNGRTVCVNSNYVHGIAATLLLNALGVSCVRYGNFSGLNTVVGLEVPAENFMTMTSREKLLYMVGDSHLGDDTLNDLIDKSYYYPYSHIILEELRPHFEKVFTLKAEFESAFYTWEHLKSLLYGYYECSIIGFSVPIGDFIRYEVEERFRHQAQTPYCRFFDGAHELRDEWAPIKQGLFGGEYDLYKQVCDKADAFYERYRRI